MCQMASVPFRYFLTFHVPCSRVCIYTKPELGHHCTCRFPSSDADTPSTVMTTAVGNLDVFLSGMSLYNPDQLAITFDVSRDPHQNKNFYSSVWEFQVKQDWIDLIHKSQNAPVPCPTMIHSDEKCAHFCSEWSIVGYGKGVFWDFFTIEPPLNEIERGTISAGKRPPPPPFFSCNNVILRRMVTNCITEMIVFIQYILRIMHWFHPCTSEFHRHCGNHTGQFKPTVQYSNAFYSSPSANDCPVPVK